MCVSQRKPIVLVCHNMASRVGTKKEGDGGAKRSPGTTDTRSDDCPDCRPNIFIISLSDANTKYANTRICKYKGQVIWKEYCKKLC